MMLERERERVAAAARRLAACGRVAGTAGNVSERAQELVAVTPTGARLEAMTTADGAVRSGERAAAEVLSAL